MRQIYRLIEKQSLPGSIHVDQGLHMRITPQLCKLLENGRMIGVWFRADPWLVTAPPSAVASH